MLRIYIFKSRCQAVSTRRDASGSFRAARRLPAAARARTTGVWRALRPRSPPADRHAACGGPAAGAESAQWIPGIEDRHDDEPALRDARAGRFRARAAGGLHRHRDVPAAAGRRDGRIGAATVATGLAIAVALPLHWTFLGIGARRMGLRVVPWVALSVLLFPVGAVAALVLLGWFAHERQVQPSAAR